MRPDEPEQAAQPIEGLDHRRKQWSVASVAGKDPADGGLETGNQIVCFLLLLFGHGFSLAQAIAGAGGCAVTVAAGR